MWKKIRRVAIGLIATIIVVGAVLRFFFGMQIVLDGGGTPHVRLVESSSEQAARIEQHRAAQRAARPPTQEAPGAQESGIRNQESGAKTLGFGRIPNS